jgi:DNA polymerase III sliding clamp (beta) subunit (PCNA family)
VQLTFGPGRVTVGAATQGQARARESVPADFAGDEPVIAFSPHYLLDGVIAATATAPVEAGEQPADRGTAGPRVRLWFTSPSKPAVITRQPDQGADEAKGAEGDFRYLVVPQRVQ